MTDNRFGDGDFEMEGSMEENFTDNLRDNLLTVHRNIEAACSRAGRRPQEVTLIAVSKTKPVEMLMGAYEAGERFFGENKVQEISEKKPLMPEDARFHMIGHLQTNKVRQVIDKVELIHSVDSLHLAETIGREAVRIERCVDILIEVNVAEEESKFGVKLWEAEDLVRKCAVIPGIRVCGLMTIAPNAVNSEENRPIFKKLKQLCVDLKAKNIDNTCMDILSMGMTGDYQVAIEEGATMVRVGTGIFGVRNYNVQ